MKIYQLVGLWFAGMVTAGVAHADCNDKLRLSTPDSRFTLHEDGTVTDKQTGLIWMRCSLGQSWESSSNSCSGAVASYNWQNALSAAEAHNFAGQTDWYLPNIRELASIIETACFEPAINSTIFPNTPSAGYWSASPAVSSRFASWATFFHDGAYGLGNKRSNFQVRLVRTAP